MTKREELSIQEKLIEFANRQIDHMCEDDPVETAKVLIEECGFTKKELVHIEFDEDIVKQAIKELK